MSQLGAVFYRGPSLLTGDPIVGILTGLERGSHNAKTGPMVQAWILRSDLAPMYAKRLNVDDAVCGDCALRGRDGRDSRCYVTVWQGPATVFKRFIIGDYHDATPEDLEALVEGRSVRLGAYGDPAAIPFDVWEQLLHTAAGWVGYSHQWRSCDPRFRSLLMASVDDVDEFENAQDDGWRTFRVRRSSEALIRGQEFVCPASDEAGHRTTCQRCQLCRGTSSPARSVAIIAHGKPSNLRAYGERVDYFGRRSAMSSTPTELTTQSLTRRVDDGVCQ